MLNYDHRWSECPNCTRYEHFKIIVVQKNDKYYYITRCPKCKAYDEVKEITLKEVQSLKLIPQKGKIA